MYQEFMKWASVFSPKEFNFFTWSIVEFVGHDSIIKKLDFFSQWWRKQVLQSKTGLREPVFSTTDTGNCVSRQVPTVCFGPRLPFP